MVTAVLLLSVGAVLAQSSAADIASELERQGFFLEQGVPVSVDDAGRLVGSARDAGEELYIVFLGNEPAAGASFFAESVVNEMLSGLVLVVAPESVGYSGQSTRATESEIASALDEALNRGSSDLDIASIFVGSLPGVDRATVPGSGSGSGGGSGLLVIVVILVAGVGIFLFLNSRKKARGGSATTVLGKAKAEVQRMLSAVANDVLEMEEEVRSADNVKVDQFYKDASATYARSMEAFDAARTPQDLLAMSNDLELAIWQLDSAEAILDGNELPPRPEPRRLEAPKPAPAVSTRPAQSGAQSGYASQLPPRPNYNRRSTRRSAPIGGGLMDLLVGAISAGAVSSGRSSRNRRRPVSSRSVRRSQPSRSSRGSGKRIRGGGRRRR